MKIAAIVLCLVAGLAMSEASKWGEFEKLLHLPVINLAECYIKHHFKPSDWSAVKALVHGHAPNQSQRNHLIGTVGCFAACSYKAAGAVVDNKFLVSHIIKLAQKHKFSKHPVATQRIQSCADQANKQSKPCNMAFELVACLIEKVV